MPLSNIFYYLIVTEENLNSGFPFKRDQSIQLSYKALGMPLSNMVTNQKLFWLCHFDPHAKKKVREGLNSFFLLGKYLRFLETS